MISMIESQNETTEKTAESFTVIEKTRTMFTDNLMNWQRMLQS